MLSMPAPTNSPLRDAEPPHAHSLVPARAERLSGAITARDGTVLWVRPLLPTDRERLQTFHAGLSLDTIVYRFFRVLPSLSAETARQLTHIDYENRMAIIATTGAGDDERIRAVVRYERTGPETAEVAFVVDDPLQGQGVAPILLRRLAEYARERGYTTLAAITMASNARMIAMLRHSGFPCSARFENGELEVRLDIREAPQVPSGR
jgi:GNAT superfamily N-acetyltransferase